jgi:Fic family protein
MAHAQFESKRPFLEGNGRFGRPPTTFIVCHDRILEKTLPYLILCFRKTVAGTMRG